MIVFHGAAKEAVEKRGLTSWSISITHTQDYAMAFVVAMSPFPPEACD